MRRKQELRKLETTLERLKTKATFHEEQMDYYNRYIETCLDNLAGKETMYVVNKLLLGFRLDAAWYLQTYCKLLKQLASNLWIKVLTINLHQACWQLAANLLSSSRSKRCERIQISAWWLQGNKPAADLPQLARFLLCNNDLFMIVIYCWSSSLFLLRSQRGEKKKPEAFKTAVKYSAQKLAEKGVVLEIEGLPKNQYVLKTTWKHLSLINMSSLMSKLHMSYKNR